MDQLGEKPENYRVTQPFIITRGFDPPTNRLREIQNSTGTHFRFLEYTREGGAMYEVSAQHKKAISKAKNKVYSSAYNHHRFITREFLPITRDDHDLLVLENEIPAIKSESKVEYITMDPTGNIDGGYIAEIKGTVESVAKGKRLLKAKLDFFRLEGINRNFA